MLKGIVRFHLEKVTILTSSMGYVYVEFTKYRGILVLPLRNFNSS